MKALYKPCGKRTPHRAHTYTMIRTWGCRGVTFKGWLASLAR